MRFIWFKDLAFVRLVSSRDGRNVKLLIYSLIIFSFSMVIYSYASTQLFSATIQSRGVVKSLGVGVYLDEACNKPVSSLDWGIVEAGAQREFILYMRNEGNAAGYLSLSSVNWNPPIASSYMRLTWDYNGQILEPYRSIKVTLKLLISQEIKGITNFNFDTIIGIG